MSQSYTQVIQELKRRIDAYLADPKAFSDEEVDELLRGVDWSQLPEDAPLPYPPASPPPEASGPKPCSPDPT